MALVREFCGYLLGVAMCLMALALSGLAWLGLENEFGWQYALGAVVAGGIVRINVALPVGLFLYASNLWGWPMPQALAFATPGLVLVIPSFAVHLFTIVVGNPARRA
ncbi:hypothetical protein IP88_12450 [alpha proteobacterium AAP81b]|nr:hypothetical protein IP88_12450 [alpha proteobacterium AAP81b]